MVQQCVLVGGSRARVYAQRRTPLADPDDMRQAHMIAGEAPRPPSVGSMVALGLPIARQAAKMPFFRAGKQSIHGFRRDDAGNSRLANDAKPFSCTASLNRGHGSHPLLFPKAPFSDRCAYRPAVFATTAVGRLFAGWAPPQAGCTRLQMLFHAGRYPPAISERVFWSLRSLREASFCNPVSQRPHRGRRP